MPKFTVEQSSSKSPEECFKKIRDLLNDDPQLKAMDSSYSCRFDDKAMSGTAKGSKFSANMKVVPSGAGAKVSIEVDLPFLLTPVKGVIQSTVEKKLIKALA